MRKITICGAPVRDFRLDAGPSEAERFAAEEFSDYCEKIGGARPAGANGTIRIAIDAPGASRRSFSFGKIGVISSKLRRLPAASGS